MDFHQQHLAIAHEVGDRHAEGIALGNLGSTELKLKQYSETSTHSQLALEIFREIGDKNNESKTLRNLAELHQSLNEIELAQQYCQQALALAAELGVPLLAECQILMESLDREAEEGKVVQEKVS
jgi:tetratricopeptide (TPR) repeat protein